MNFSRCNFEIYFIQFIAACAITFNYCFMFKIIYKSSAAGRVESSSRTHCQEVEKSALDLSVLFPPQQIRTSYFSILNKVTVIPNSFICWVMAIIHCYK